MSIVCCLFWLRGLLQSQMLHVDCLIVGKAAKILVTYMKINQITSFKTEFNFRLAEFMARVVKLSLNFKLTSKYKLTCFLYSYKGYYYIFNASNLRINLGSLAFN